MTEFKPMTRAEFEAALDAGILEIQEVTLKGEVKWYRCRRNGRTRTWKRDPSRFIIPVKYKFRECVQITQDHIQLNHWFRTRESQR